MLRTALRRPRFWQTPPMHCPACQADIPPEDVNIAADTAMCRGCGELSRPSDAVAGKRIGLGDASLGELLIGWLFITPFVLIGPGTAAPVGRSASARRSPARGWRGSRPRSAAT